MIDTDGFRPNVGIILAKGNGEVFWAKRLRQNDSWQFPQGGIDRGESPQDAMFRELYEEIGLQSSDVKVVAQTNAWLRYRIPEHLQQRKQTPTCIGQKQKWFLLQLQSDPTSIVLDRSGKPEFCDWRWVSYWYPVGKIVSFKRDVYRRAMKELALVHNQLVVD